MCSGRCDASSSLAKTTRSATELLFGFFLVLNLLCVCDGFNLDTKNYAVFGGQTGSMFGFTVATHRVQGNSWVLVGAPEAQSRQPNVDRGGVVFKCQADSDNSCQEILFDINGSNLDSNQMPMDSKSRQWFGATLQSAGEDKPVVACAPRYVYYGTKGDRRDPVGTCYVSSPDLTRYSEYSPCRTRFFGYHRHGSCQAGFSAALTNDTDRLFIGAPGSYYWQGQTYSIDAHATFTYTPGIFSNFGSKGSVTQQPLEKRPAVVSTNEGHLSDDDSYMGYSMAVGDFTGEGVQGVAVGKPRGAHLLGQIILFTWNLTNYQNISLEEYGGQIGTYFGYSIAAADIDGDDTDDLIVGAPLHTEANNEGKYEVGRVYVIFQGREAYRFRRFTTIDGFKSKSRFGLSLASLGDINMDGYDDFAVGAPYDGPREHGAVYIYHGGKNLAEAKYAQVIYAEDVSQSFLVSTFGFSIAGGIDLDQNEYPDLAVGAYQTNNAFFFRARPIVKIESRVNFVNRNKKIVLEEKNCTLRNGQRVACATVDICMTFRGRGVPTTIDLDVQYFLDGKKSKDPRMFFMIDEGKTMINESARLYKDQREICKQKIVYIKNDIRDKLTALEIEVKYSMRDSESQYQYRQRDPRIPLRPILDANNKQSNKDALMIHKNCGPDNICIPNLKLEVNSNVERFLLGSNEKLEFDVVVRNLGEDSFESTFKMHLPEGIHFNKIQEFDKPEVRILCSAAENNTIQCDIGNPLPANKIARFKVYLVTATHKEGMRPSYDFLMMVNSTNPENDRTVFDNRIEKSIPIWVNSQLDLSGTSKPSEVHYNASLYTAEKIVRESHIGPQVTHLYSIKNNGPSSIKEAEVLFLWPFATLSGDDLLYLLEQPHTLGNIKCELAEANYRGYKLEVRKKDIWDSLGISRSEFASLSQPGGLVVIEGPGTHGSTPKVSLNTGDKVLTVEERQRQSHHKVTSSSSGGGSSIIHVGEDTGSGSSVSETHVAKVWKQNGTGDGTSYTQNIHGGKVTITETHYGSSGSGQQYSGSQGGVTHSSSGSSWGTGSAGSDLFGQDVANIHYTSTGNKQLESGISLSTRGGSASASSSGTMDGGRIDHTTYVEGRRSGQEFNASDGGHTRFEAESYPRRNKTLHLNRHFNWGTNQSTSGSTSSADVYNENRLFYEQRRREEEERIRIEEERRIHEQEAHQQEEKRRRQEEERIRLEIERREQERQTEERRHQERIWREEEERRRLEEHKVRVEEEERRQLEETRLREERHRIEEEYRRRQEAELEERRRLEVQQRLGHHEERHEQHSYYGGGTSGQTHTQDSRYNVPYSEEKYTDSEEEYQDIHTQSRGSSTFNKSYSSSGHATSGHGTHTEGRHDFGSIAAGGQGFRTQALDIGTLSGASGSGHSSGGTYSQGGYGQTQGHSDRTHYEGRSESSWSSSTGTVGRDNVPTDKPNYQNRFHGRRRRDAEYTEKDIKDFMTCQATKCLTIKCNVGPLLKDQFALIALRSRVNVRTLRNISTSQSINFSSMMLARIEKLPFIGRPLNRTVHSHEIFTTVPAPEPDIKPDIVPLWVIVLSAVGGTILLLLLIYLLHKLGFFKRNRPSNAPERQPLNRNAYYNGDQAL